MTNFLISNLVLDKIKWLLVKGGRKHACLDAFIKFQDMLWLHIGSNLFNTRIFDYIQQLFLARAITTGYSSDFEKLESDLEFDIKKQEGCCVFACLTYELVE